MSENQKETRKEGPSFFEGAPFAEMMRKIMGGAKCGQAFDCAEMMSKMMPLCCKFMSKKEEPDQEKAK